jgi:hypothetical protein
MQEHPIAGQEVLALSIPVVCTHCGVAVTDALDPELEAKLLDHLCADTRRWCA